MASNPLELALSELAKSMGFALSGVTKSSESILGLNNARNTEENQLLASLEQPETQPAPGPVDEEEEGEVADEPPQHPIVPHPKPKKPVKPIAQSRIPYTGDVDAESLMRGPPQKGAKKPRPEHLKVKSPTKVVEEPAKRAPRVPCRYWMEGKCSKGDECTFSHAIKPHRTVEEAKTEEICRFHIVGNCLKGDSCLYSHDLSKMPCKFFHARGECSAGVSCRFSHGPISEEARRQLFVETMGARDPRINGGSGGPVAPELAQTKSPPTVREAPCDHFLDMVLSPAVARLNPFGSPF